MSFKDALNRSIYGGMVGSHIWQMAHKGSDQDEFWFYVANTREFLRGTADTKSYFEAKWQGTNRDVHVHEAGKVVTQLLSGNINFVLGVCSPRPLYETEQSHALKRITLNNLSTKSWYSINGMCKSQLKKYASIPVKDQAKRWPKLVRAIQFGVHLFEKGELKFEPADKSSYSYDEVEERLKELEAAKENSILPDEPNEEPFRGWLERVRLEWLEDIKLEELGAY